MVSMRAIRWAYTEITLAHTHARHQALLALDGAVEEGACAVGCGGARLLGALAQCANLLVSCSPSLGAGDSPSLPPSRL